MNGDRSELGPRRRNFALPVRPNRGRMVAGVCQALAEQLAVDVTLVRLAFVVLGLAWGIGVLLYVALWVLMPDANAPGPVTNVKRSVRYNVARMSDDVRGTGSRLRDAWDQVRPGRPLGVLDRPSIAIGIVVVGLLLLLGSVGAFAWVTPVRLLGLAAILAGIGVLLTLGGRR